MLIRRQSRNRRATHENPGGCGKNNSSAAAAGIMTDTHVAGMKTSCKLLKEALTLFKQKSVDMVVNPGDISDIYEELAYKNYRDTVKEVYGDTLPHEVFVFANHDRMAREKDAAWEVFKDVKKHLEVSVLPVLYHRYV